MRRQPTGTETGAGFTAEANHRGDLESTVRDIVHELSRSFHFTRRETEASTLLADGLRAKEIAHAMSCSDKMVYAHLARVCQKTGCRDTHEFVCSLLAFASTRPRCVRRRQGCANPGYRSGTSPNLPDWTSTKAWRISSKLFMTKGP
jgi:DNA-binding CsgD family transcriptional regulator